MFGLMVFVWSKMNFISNINMDPWRDSWSVNSAYAAKHLKKIQIISQDQLYKRGPLSNKVALRGQ